MMLFPRPLPALLVALALAACALASTSAAQSTSSDEQHLVVAQRPGTSLSSALAVRHLTPADLKLRRTTQDGGGRRHHRYRQTFNGLDVIGGDLVVHTDAQGSIYAINGAARGNLPASLGQHDIGSSAALSFVQADTRFAGMSTSAPRVVYLITPEGATFKAYEILAEGERAQTPVRDKVYIDVDSGTVVGVHPQIHSGLNRSVHSANNGTSLPGTLRRSEGQIRNVGPGRQRGLRRHGRHIQRVPEFLESRFVRQRGRNAQEHRPLLLQLLQCLLEWQSDGLRRRQYRPGLLAARPQRRHNCARTHSCGDAERVRLDLLRRVGRFERSNVRYLRRVHASVGRRRSERECSPSPQTRGRSARTC